MYAYSTCIVNSDNKSDILLSVVRVCVCVWVHATGCNSVPRKYFMYVLVLYTYVHMYKHVELYYVHVYYRYCVAKVAITILTVLGV